MKLATSTGDPASLGVLLADVDHFKAINDTRGHLEGDRVLAAIAELLADTLVSTPRAALYRYGGEEFAVLVPGIDGPEFARLAEALRDAVDRGGAGLVPREVSISLGAALWRQASETPEAALQRADEALYAAKNNGRNRVHLSDP